MIRPDGTPEPGWETEHPDPPEHGTLHYLYWGHWWTVDSWGNRERHEYYTENQVSQAKQKPDRSRLYGAIILIIWAVVPSAFLIWYHFFREAGS